MKTRLSHDQQLCAIVGRRQVTRTFNHCFWQQCRALRNPVVNTWRKQPRALHIYALEADWNGAQDPSTSTYHSYRLNPENDMVAKRLSSRNPPGILCRFPTSVPTDPLGTFFFQASKTSVRHLYQFSFYSLYPYLTTDMK